MKHVKSLHNVFEFFTWVTSHSIFQFGNILKRYELCTQGRRDPNVGPGPTQIWRSSGFVKSKIDKENAAVWSEKWCDLQKKKVFTEILTVFLAEIKWSQKKRSSPKFWRFFRWAFHFSMYFQWALSRAYGPPKLHGPRDHCPPLPPYRWPCVYRSRIQTVTFHFSCKITRSTERRFFIALYVSRRAISISHYPTTILWHN